MRLKVDIHLNWSEFKVNRVIKYFVLSDLFFWGGWGLINPIFALFVVGRIADASVLTVGIATALYWIVKALSQIPIALYLDRRDRDHFDLHFLIIGLMFAGFVAMLFPLVTSVGMLYALMILQGLAYGIYTPSWSAVFSRHLDKNHYAFDWSLDSTTVGLSSGIAALIGGAVAGIFGFDAVFVLTGLFSFLSGLLLLAVPDLVMPKQTLVVPPILPDVMKE
jgi:DHA1 family multidrug resistance protein-like MFS transporter